MLCVEAFNEASELWYQKQFNPILSVTNSQPIVCIADLNASVMYYVPVHPLPSAFYQIGLSLINSEFGWQRIGRLLSGAETLLGWRLTEHW